MLGLGAWEIVLVLIVALVVLGPDKIPEVARKLARFVGQVRRMADDVRRNIDEAIADPEPPPQATFADWFTAQQQAQQKLLPGEAASIASEQAGAAGGQPARAAEPQVAPTSGTVAAAGAASAPPAPAPQLRATPAGEVVATVPSSQAQLAPAGELGPTAPLNKGRVP